MKNLAHVGDFCPNDICQDYGKIQGENQHNIIKYGRTKAGRQRFQCKTCNQTFAETKGTLFYRCRTPEAKILHVLSLIAEGNRISSLERVTGHKEDTIIDWIRKAGKHAEEVEEVLLSEYHLTRGQIDGLWTFVGHKGEKKTP